VLSNIGTWMRDTASAWAMAEMAPSPLLVSLVQAATTLPVFLLALPAGALADILDKKRLMIAVQGLLAVVSITLAALVFFDALTPLRLLILTFLGGVGAAITGPVWQSVVPQLVDKPQLRAAVAMNSLGVNLSRAIGPAFGGFLIAAAGLEAAYALDVATYAVVLAALFWWRPREGAPAHAERLGQAMQAGLRYTMWSPPLRRVLIRAFLFFVPGSAFWALLPLVSREQLKGGPETYGLLLAAIGGGAVFGALLLPRARGLLGNHGTVIAGSLLLAACTAVLALAPSFSAALGAMFATGIAWIAVLTSLNATTQAVLPNWVRGRGLAVYLTVFFGAMTAGSVLWGQIGALTDVPTALLLAAATGVVFTVIGMSAKLPEADVDLAPSMHWPAPIVADGMATDTGPIMVTIDYEVAPAKHATMKAALEALAPTRRRDGAIAWGIQVDLENPTRVREWFMVASWEEHLRQHERFPAADRPLQNTVNALHEGEAPPIVRHWAELNAARAVDRSFIDHRHDHA
jgi:MFS family permease